MCGITGVFGPSITKDDLAIFYQLMIVNQLRGMHSTGVLRVFRESSKKKPVISKDVVTAQEFFDKKENAEILENVWPVAIMGHCRHATVGNADNIAGAHPFENDKYIGFHNGTLREDKYTKYSPFFTDSEALYNEIALNSPEKVLPVLREDSAFALAWYNKENHSISFVRNKHRPLAFAVNAKRNVVYYSSEIGMLEMVLNRMGIEYYSYGLRQWTVATCSPERPSFNDADVRADKKKETARTNLWKIKDLTPNPPPKEEPKTVVSRYGIKADSNWYNELWGSGGNVVASSSTDSGDRKCTNCSDTLVYHKGTGQEIKDKNPKNIEGFGDVCPDCFDTFVNLKHIDSNGTMILN